MKNSAIVRIVIWSVVIVFLIAAVAVVIFGESWGLGDNISFGIGPGYKYSDASSYSIGDFSANADSVSSLDVEWISGSVSISEHDGDEIKVSEVGSEDEDTVMRYRIKDGKISIRFCKSGWNSAVFGIGDKTLHKDLTILVPKGKQFKDIDMELVSAKLDVDAEGLSAEDLDIETVSGAVNIDNFTAEDINIEAVSGSVTLRNVSCKAVDIETVSGRINYYGAAGEIDFNTVSGSTESELAEAPRRLSIETVSGSSTVKMPKTGIKASIDRVSGDITAFGEDISKCDDITLGDGYMELDVSTVSGDVDIIEWVEE